MNDEIARRRLGRQRLTGDRLPRPERVVAWLGAVQAQEYDPAKWAIGLRMREGAAAGDVEHALDAGRILRTHVMRPTWHFVAAADLRWLQALTGPRVRRVMASYDRRLGLDARTITRGLGLIERTLAGQTSLTRSELGAALQRRGLTLDRLALTNLVMHAELEAVVCSGPRRGAHHTYALLSERVPATPDLSRDEALAALTQRFFTSHGPATLRDFAWWSGLTVGDARRGVEMNRAKRETADGLTYWTIGQDRRGDGTHGPVHLLPIYDEYLIAYRDRVAVPHQPSGVRGDALEAVTFQHALVIDGQVAGTWRTTRDAGPEGLAVIPFRRLARAERTALEEAVQRYRAFTG